MVSIWLWSRALANEHAVYNIHAQNPKGVTIGWDPVLSSPYWKLVVPVLCMGFTSTWSSLTGWSLWSWGVPMGILSSFAALHSGFFGTFTLLKLTSCNILDLDQIAVLVATTVVLAFQYTNGILTVYERWKYLSNGLFAQLTSVTMGDLWPSQVLWGIGPQRNIGSVTVLSTEFNIRRRIYWNTFGPILYIRCPWLVFTWIRKQNPDRFESVFSATYGALATGCLIFALFTYSNKFVLAHHRSHLSVWRDVLMSIATLAYTGMVYALRTSTIVISLDILLIFAAIIRSSGNVYVRLVPDSGLHPHVRNSSNDRAMDGTTIRGAYSAPLLLDSPQSLASILFAGQEVRTMLTAMLEHENREHNASKELCHEHPELVFRDLCIAITHILRDLVRNLADDSNTQKTLSDAVILLLRSSQELENTAIELIRLVLAQPEYESATVLPSKSFMGQDTPYVKHDTSGPGNKDFAHNEINVLLQSDSYRDFETSISDLAHKLYEERLISVFHNDSLVGPSGDCLVGSARALMIHEMSWVPTYLFTVSYYGLSSILSKASVEHCLGETWNWWPLGPALFRTKSGYKRINWISVRIRYLVC
jgi:hypothetical protein